MHPFINHSARHDRSARARRALAAVMAAVLATILTGAPASHAAGRCTKTSVSKTPLTELGPATYQGFEGGLYPGGVNVRPEQHDALLDRAGRVMLLDPMGRPDDQNGLFVLLSIGMSNATQEFSAFQQKAQQDPTRNPQLVIVDGAEPGQAAQDIADPDAPYWKRVDNRVRAAGADPRQVQVIWLKEARREPTEPFPLDAELLQRDLRTIVQIIKDRYPNAQVVYLASRIYAGYATDDLNPEPYAYQSGFAARWLIEEQLEGDPALNFDPSRGPVTSPWLSWGPYMWADGTNPRSDGVVWECRDFERDGTHPSRKGRNKVANMLLDFFQSDDTAKSWYADCNRSDPGTFAAPPTVQNVTVSGDPGDVSVSWDDLGPVVGPSVVYDVTTGFIADLRADEGFNRASCLATRLDASGIKDRSVSPDGSAGSWYLVRGRNSCGTGSWGAGARHRDGLDAMVACP